MMLMLLRSNGKVPMLVLFLTMATMQRHRDVDQNSYGRVFPEAVCWQIKVESAALPTTTEKNPYICTDVNSGDNTPSPRLSDFCPLAPYLFHSITHLNAVSCFNWPANLIALAPQLRTSFSFRRQVKAYLISILHLSNWSIWLNLHNQFDAVFT